MFSFGSQSAWPAAVAPVSIEAAGPSCNCNLRFGADEDQVLGSWYSYIGWSVRMPLADIVRGDSSRQVDPQTERPNLIRRARLEVLEPASYADRGRS